MSLPKVGDKLISNCDGSGVIVTGVGASGELQVTAVAGPYAGCAGTIPPGTLRWWSPAAPIPLTLFAVGDYVRHRVHGWQGEVDDVSTTPGGRLVSVALISGQHWHAYADAWELWTHPTPIASREPRCTRCSTRNEYQPGPYLCGNCRHDLEMMK